MDERCYFILKNKLPVGHGATPTPESANDVVHCPKIIELHALSDIVRSIRDPIQFDDFLAGLIHMISHV